VFILWRWRRASRSSASAGRFCAKCGAAQAVDNRFCGNCGAKVA
jgi:predicted amidophosphoribosyltransferase